MIKFNINNREMINELSDPTESIIDMIKDYEEDLE